MSYALERNRYLQVPQTHDYDDDDDDDDNDEDDSHDDNNFNVDDDK